MSDISQFMYPLCNEQTIQISHYADTLAPKLICTQLTTDRTKTSFKGGSRPLILGFSTCFINAHPPQNTIAEKCKINVELLQLGSMLFVLPLWPYLS